LGSNFRGGQVRVALETLVDFSDDPRVVEIFVSLIFWSSFERLLHLLFFDPFLSFLEFNRKLKVPFKFD
jgi:hypothetical protein